MKGTNKTMVQRASVIAINSALSALALGSAGVQAAEGEAAVRELTEPSSTIEVGAGYVNRASRKFGEYNGLDNKGVYPIGEFDLRGGDPYDSDGSWRWRARGLDLGLRTRELSLDLGQQGRFRITGGYSESLRTQWDGYVTPYGGGGSTALTLGNYPAASARGATGATSWNNIQNAAPAAAILARLSSFDIETQRNRVELGFGLNLTPEYEVKASIRHETKDGTKLTGAAFGGFRGAFLPEPIDYVTDQIEASIGYAGKALHWQVGYFGSVFKNDVNVWTAANPFAGNALATAAADRIYLGSMPDNEFHQLNLSGGYKFSPTTRLTLAAGYGRGTQNAAYAITPGTGFVPVGSLNGEVIRSNIDAKLTMRPVTGLNLALAYKYDDRDNRTASNGYAHGEADAPTTIPNPIPANSSLLHVNEPLSRRLQQISFDADYQVARGQAVKAAYEWQQIRRECGGPETDCFDTATTRENTLRIEYRNNMSPTLTGRLGYAYSDRTTSEYSDPSPSAGARRSFLAPRQRDKIRSAISFVPAEALSLQASIDYNRDRYTDTRYGLKDSHSWAANFDVAYAIGDDTSLTAFYSYEDLRNRIDGNAATVPGTAPAPATCGTILGTTQPVNAARDPCRDWFMTGSDKVHTFGIGFVHKGLLGGRMELKGDLVYTEAKSPVDLTGATYYSDGTNLIYVPATSFPNATSKMIDLRLSAKYALSPASAIRVGYQYRRLSGEDWQWDAYRDAGITAVQAFVGTGIQAPHYDVHAIGVAYMHSFR